MARPCIFCQIIQKTLEGNILYEDEDVVVIFDKFPASKTHFLVLPRQHIQTAKDLKAEHTPLVEKMVATGRKLMTEKYNDDMKDTRCGFTWPPFNTVNHLHLHFIYPGSTLTPLRKLMFLEKNLWL